MPRPTSARNSRRVREVFIKNLLSNHSVNESGNHAQLIRPLETSSSELPEAAGAHLVTTTKRPEEIGSLSSPTGGEGWGEEAHSTGYPSPHPSPRSFLAGRGRRRFPVVGTRCAQAAGR